MEVVTRAAHKSINRIMMPTFKFGQITASPGGKNPFATLSKAQNDDQVDVFGFAPPALERLFGCRQGEV